MSGVSLLDGVLMFVSNFFVVFLLGLQSKNVNQGHYMAAVITSLGISTANFTFIKYAAQGSYMTFAICAAGGCAGIAFSIWFYAKILEPRRSQS
jgi:FtsH-binding integral membrane protein